MSLIGKSGRECYGKIPLSQWFTDRVTRTAGTSKFLLLKSYSWCACGSWSCTINGVELLGAAVGLIVASCLKRWVLLGAVVPEPVQFWLAKAWNLGSGSTALVCGQASCTHTTMAVVFDGPHQSGAGTEKRLDAGDKIFWCTELEPEPETWVAAPQPCYCGQFGSGKIVFWSTSRTISRQRYMRPLSERTTHALLGASVQWLVEHSLS